MNPQNLPLGKSKLRLLEKADLKQLFSSESNLAGRDCETDGAGSARSKQSRLSVLSAP